MTCHFSHLTIIRTTIGLCVVILLLRLNPLENQRCNWIFPNYVANNSEDIALTIPRSTVITRPAARSTQGENFNVESDKTTLGQFFPVNLPVFCVYCITSTCALCMKIFFCVPDVQDQSWIETKIKRTDAVINKQLISSIFKNSDPFSAPLTVRPDWTYPHTNWRAEFFELCWTEYVEPNLGSLEFYLEIGSFKAGSIVRLAEHLKKKHLESGEWKKTSLVCMDPFTGDVNMWDWNNGQKRDHDFLATSSSGRPQIFETFMANVVDKGHQDMILPVVVGGLVGMKLLGRLFEDGRITKMPDVIYLDSAHEKDETYLELKQAWIILRDCGMLMGDDWSWRAVRDDVSKFAMELALPELALHPGTSQPVPGVVLGPNGQWSIIKGGTGNKCV